MIGLCKSVFVCLIFGVDLQKICGYIFKVFVLKNIGNVDMDRCFQFGKRFVNFGFFGFKVIWGVCKYSFVGV